MEKHNSENLQISLIFFVVCVSSIMAIDSHIPDINTISQPGNKKLSPEEKEVWCKPEQVHISSGDSPAEVIVMWTTLAKCSAHVLFSEQPWNLSRQAEAQTIEMTDKKDKSLRFIHRAVLKDLLPSTTYFYRPVASNDVGIEPMYFKSASGKDAKSKVTLLISNGLSGDEEKAALSAINEEVSSGSVSAFIYNGNIEEKLIPSEGESDNQFLSSIKQIAAYHPFMTLAGKKDNDGLYRYRHMFSMPKTAWPMPENKLWYSFDLGLVHIISYYTDVLVSSNESLAKSQKLWLVNDLKEANKRRAQTPWIVAFGREPMYCAFGPASADCAKNASKVRIGLEDMFYVFGVDLVVESADRCYERSWPKYKSVITNLDAPYDQPRAPVEVVMGSSGYEYDGDSHNNASSTATPAWSAFHLGEKQKPSYGRLTVFNATHLKWELVSAEEHKLLDTFVIVQETHGNFNLANLPHNVSHQINQTIIAQGGKPGTYDFINGVETGLPGGEGPGWSQYSVYLGLGTVAAVLAVVLGIVTLRSCVKRRRVNASRRRWRDGDSGDAGAKGGFYSVGSGSDTEEDDNDFEIDVYDKANKQSSKLLTSY